MIISFSQQFIFLHARKTGGTSVIGTLAPLLGKRDIPLSGLEEMWEDGIDFPRLVYLRAASGVLRNPAHLKYVLAGKFGRFLAMSAKQYYSRTLGSQPQHASARAVSEAFPNEWKTFFRFSIIRNPYSMVVSDFFWRTKGTKREVQFDEFVEAIHAGRHLPGTIPVTSQTNWDKYSIDDTLVLDDYLRFESLESDFQRVASRLGYNNSLYLPAFKRLRVPGRKDYRSYYTTTTKKLISELYAKELDAFDYDF